MHISSTIIETFDNSCAIEQSSFIISSKTLNKLFIQYYEKLIGTARFVYCADSWVIYIINILLQRRFSDQFITDLQFQNRENRIGPLTQYDTSVCIIICYDEGGLKFALLGDYLVTAHPLPQNPDLRSVRFTTCQTEHKHFKRYNDPGWSPTQTLINPIAQLVYITRQPHTHSTV